MMTREEKLYSMTMKMLIMEAEKLGVKIDKKGSKQKAVEKMLAAEAAEQKKPVEVVTIEEPAKEEPAAAVQDTETVKKPVKKEKAKKEKAKKEKVNTFDIVCSILDEMLLSDNFNIIYKITPQGKGMSIKKDGEKIVELWKRLNRVRMLISAENLARINADLLEDITDNPSMKKYNKSVYIPVENIKEVLTAVIM